MNVIETAKIIAAKTRCFDLPPVAPLTGGAGGDWFMNNSLPEMQTRATGQDLAARRADRTPLIR
jgi:hypothetical protein